MERNRYCRCTTGKLTSRCPTCSGDTWEERAFAEDALGLLGGCVWPPRSYSCSFCRREFRSAQALGGHMNVHRRDRARLRECSPSQASTQNNNEEGSWASRKSHVTAPNFLLSGYLRARSSLSDSLLRRAKVEAALGLTFEERKVGRKDKRGSTSEKEEEEGTTSGYKRVIAVAGLSPHSYVHPKRSLHDGGGLTVSREDHDVDLELRLGITRKAKFDVIQNIKY